MHLFEHFQRFFLRILTDHFDDFICREHLARQLVRGYVSFPFANFSLVHGFIVSYLAVYFFSYFFAVLLLRFLYNFRVNLECTEIVTRFAEEQISDYLQRIEELMSGHGRRYNIRLVC